MLIALTSEKSTYSACPGETPDWSIGAERIELNKTERGVARKASLNIHKTRGACTLLIISIER